MGMADVITKGRSLSMCLASLEQMFPSYSFTKYDEEDAFIDGFDITKQLNFLGFRFEVTLATVIPAEPPADNYNITFFGWYFYDHAAIKKAILALPIQSRTPHGYRRFKFQN